jgi:hypothetical protein
VFSHAAQLAPAKSSRTAKDAATSAGVKKGNSEHGDTQVASLKMVEQFLQIGLATPQTHFLPAATGYINV